MNAEKKMELEKLLHSNNYKDRINAAKAGYRLDVLFCDRHIDVRCVVDKYLNEHNYKSVIDWAKDNNVKIDIDEWLNSNNYYKRCTVAEQGYRLDVLFDDKVMFVRDAVREYLQEHNYKSIFEWAKDNNVEIDIDEWIYSDDYHKRRAAAVAGYGLDVLVNDENYDVREAVAEQGYGLDKLINDEDWQVRIKVVRQGYGLDKLINDRHEYVREAVAKQGYGLDNLINDEDYFVRAEVARQGYGLDVLIGDKENYVHDVVQNYLQDHNYKSIFDWAKDNGLNIIDEWLHDNWHKRYEVAKAGYHLDVLFCDKDKDVREAVHNYLKEHNYESVIDWAKDNNVEINFDEWLHSGNWHKRYEVAKYGYRLDVLFDDVDEDVCIAVKNYLEEHNYESVIDWAKDNLDKHKYKYIDDCIKDNSSTNTKQVDLSETINTFIDNIENSSILAVQTDLDSIDDFFNNDSAKIDIVTIDTKIPIITITALKEDEYKFELNVTDNTMSSTFTTTDKFNKLMDLAISELNENNEFYKYADDLNNCL